MYEGKGMMGSSKKKQERTIEKARLNKD